MSNYVGFMLEQAAELGYKKIVLAGAVGKLMKLAAGIMNTHSHIADGRNEIICTHAALLGATKDIIQELLPCHVVNDVTVVHHNQAVSDLNRIAHPNIR